MKHLPSLLAPALVLAASLAAATGVADGTEVVFAAIQSGDPALLNAVLEETPSLASATNASGMMPLHFAARVGQAGATETLLAAGADPNAALAKSAGTPLHYAANVDAADVAAILLARGAKTEAKAVNGRTPLHFAAAKGNDAAAAALLGAGADPNAADPQGQTPLHLAAIAGHPSTIRVLLGAGADPEIPDAKGAVPADLAVRDEVLLAFRAAPAELPAVPAAASPSEAAAPLPFAPAAPAVAGTDELRFVDTAPAAPEADVQARAIAAAAVFRDEALSPADRYLRFKAAEGTRMQPDGAYYNGGIAKNRFEGYGVLLAANGRDRYEGFFRRGAKQGHGIWFYANGDALECNFAGDAPDGPGTFTYAGGETVQGTWRQGRLVEGEGVVPTDGGARFRCLWTEGKLVSSAPLD